MNRQPIDYKKRSNLQKQQNRGDRTKKKPGGTKISKLPPALSLIIRFGLLLLLGLILLFFLYPDNNDTVVFNEAEQFVPPGDYLSFLLINVVDSELTIHSFSLLVYNYETNDLICTVIPADVIIRYQENNTGKSLLDLYQSNNIGNFTLEVNQLFDQNLGLSFYVLIKPSLFRAIIPYMPDIKFYKKGIEESELSEEIIPLQDPDLIRFNARYTLEYLGEIPDRHPEARFMNNQSSLLWLYYNIFQARYIIPFALENSPGYESESRYHNIEGNHSLIKHLLNIHYHLAESDLFYYPFDFSMEDGHYYLTEEELDQFYDFVEDPLYYVDEIPKNFQLVFYDKSGDNISAVNIVNFFDQLNGKVVDKMSISAEDPRRDASILLYTPGSINLALYLAKALGIRHIYNIPIADQKQFDILLIAGKDISHHFQ